MKQPSMEGSKQLPERPLSSEELKLLELFCEAVLREPKNSPVLKKLAEEIRAEMREAAAKYPEETKIFTNSEDSRKEQEKNLAGFVYPDEIQLTPVGLPLVVLRKWEGWNWQGWGSHPELVEVDYTCWWGVSHAVINGRPHFHFVFQATFPKIRKDLCLKFTPEEHFDALSAYRQGAQVLVLNARLEWGKIPRYGVTFRTDEIEPLYFLDYWQVRQKALADFRKMS